jgi:orotidine-5'-phosphate decarboxylase
MPSARPTNPICCAIDRPDLAGALDLVRALADSVGWVKLGLEFFTANGPAGVAAVAATGVPLFLDLKLHDIPNTVAGAVRAVTRLPVDLLTLHASGGRAMLEAAVRARDAAGRRLRLLGVTVLTSLDARDLEELGIARTPADQVLALAEIALEAGVDGLVCSPREVAALRRRFGSSPLLVVPGIRPGGGDDDQKRTLDPRCARELGADLLVIGRPITAAADPRAAAGAILASLGGEAVA